MAMKPIDHGDVGKKNYTISVTSGFIEKHVDPDCAKRQRSARVQQLMSHALDMHRLNRRTIRLMLTGRIESYQNQRVEIFTLLTIMWDPHVLGTICAVETDIDAPRKVMQRFIQENEVLLRGKYKIDVALARKSINILHDQVLLLQPSVIYTIIDSVQRFHMRTHLWEQGKIASQPQVIDLFEEVDDE